MVKVDQTFICLFVSLQIQRTTMFLFVLFIILSPVSLAIDNAGCSPKIKYGSYKGNSDLSNIYYHIQITHLISEDCTEAELTTVRGYVEVEIPASQLIPANTSNGTSIVLNSRGCKLDTNSIRVHGFENGTAINYSIEDVSQEPNQATDVEYEEDEVDGNKVSYRIQINETIDLNAKILLMVPYTLNLSRSYYETSWEGFYMYTALTSNVTDELLYLHLPLHAQFMFPVIAARSPEIKPTFKIDVFHPHDFVVLSNTEVEATFNCLSDKNMVFTSFRQTPPIDPAQITVWVLQNFQKLNTDTTKVETNATTNANVTINLWYFVAETYNEPYEFLLNNSHKTKSGLQSQLNYFQGKFKKIIQPTQKVDVILVPWYTEDYGYYSNLGIAAGKYVNNN